MTPLVTIARLEFVSASRLKWIRVLTVAFASLAVAAAYAAGAAAEVDGPDGFARTTMTLVPVALILVPLAAVILGVSGQAAESGSEAFLFAQPASRADVVIGRWMGQLAALGGAIVLGFGSGAILIVTSTGLAGWQSLASFTGASIALAAIFLSLAAAIAAVADKRVTALGVATFAWFLFVLLYDGVALSVAGWLTGSIGGRVLFASVFGNPADLIRIAMLLSGGTANVLGAAGEAWIRFLGGDGRAVAAMLVELLLWIAVPIAAGAAMLNRRDL
jgi:Cu-processing system permease protein